MSELFISLVILLFMLGYIFYSRGGAIQQIVKSKTNTVDIRSATIIDFLYGLVLLFFKELSNVPMSTTWVFLGLLAGREIAIRYRLGREDYTPTGIFKTLTIAANVLVFGFVVYIVGNSIYLFVTQPDTSISINNGFIIAFAVAIIIRAAVAYFETRDKENPMHKTYRMIGSDLAKVFFGLVVSVVLVLLLKNLTG